MYLFGDCAGSLLLPICRLSLAAVSGGYPLPRSVGFSYRRAQALGVGASAVAAHRLQQLWLEGSGACGFQ